MWALIKVEPRQMMLHYSTCYWNS